MGYETKNAAFTRKNRANWRHRARRVNSQLKFSFKPSAISNQQADGLQNLELLIILIGFDKITKRGD
ncbi:hypothetical protein JZU51_03105 [bacterium]|nr:hypothetical protein [bacterium]